MIPAWLLLTLAIVGSDTQLRFRLVLAESFVWCRGNLTMIWLLGKGLP